MDHVIARDNIFEDIPDIGPGQRLPVGGRPKDRELLILGTAKVLMTYLAV
jgi:hypothetical protein